MHWAKSLSCLAILSCLALASPGCAFLANRWDFDEPNTAAVANKPASREQWWRDNKSRATFVLGKGYSVPGVEGYFDANGKPIGDEGVQQASFTPAAGQRSTWSSLTSLESYEPSAIVSNVKAVVGRGPDQTAAGALFSEGDDLFRRKEYDDAAEKYAAAAQRWPDSPLEHDAMFWQAESLFFADRYPAAVDAIQRLVKKYPGTRYLDKVMEREYSIARYWQLTYEQDPEWFLTPNFMDETRNRFDTIGHALRAYEHIRLSDPTGDLADDALLATANVHFRRGRYDESDYYYGLLRSEYPKSEHQKAAHLLGLESKLRRYQGPDYDGKALDEAEDLAKQILIQFSSQELGPEDQDRVFKLKAEIEAQQALRVWNRAEFYAKSNYYGAARTYYERIVKQYPTTKLAEESRRRLDEYQDLPNQPTPPLERLASAVGLGRLVDSNAGTASADESMAPLKRGVNSSSWVLGGNDSWSVAPADPDSSPAANVSSLPDPDLNR